MQYYIKCTIQDGQKPAGEAEKRVILLLLGLRLGELWERVWFTRRFSISLANFLSPRAKKSSKLLARSFLANEGPWKMKDWSGQHRKFGAAPN